MSDKRFLFFENFRDIADKLPDDMRLKFYDALMGYVFEGKEPEDIVIAALITAIKPSLDKEETRGGNHNPTGQNQYSEVKRGQKRSKTILSRSKMDKVVNPFLKRKRKQERKKKII